MAYGSQRSFTSVAYGSFVRMVRTSPSAVYSAPRSHAARGLSSAVRCREAATFSAVIFSPLEKTTLSFSVMRQSVGLMFSARSASHGCGRISSSSRNSVSPMPQRRTYQPVHSFAGSIVLSVTSSVPPTRMIFFPSAAFCVPQPRRARERATSASVHRRWSILFMVFPPVGDSYFLILGSRWSRRASPKRLNTIMTEIMTMLGASAAHGACRRYFCPSLIMAPHSASGILTPIPR